MADVERIWAAAWSVLRSHGYADTEEYGECFCGEIYEDSMDMAAHELEQLAVRGILIQPAGWVPVVEDGVF
jgi:hypothetical protein